MIENSMLTALGISTYKVRSKVGGWDKEEDTIKSIDLTQEMIGRPNHQHSLWVIVIKEGDRIFTIGEARDFRNPAIHLASCGWSFADIDYVLEVYGSDRNSEGCYQTNSLYTLAVYKPERGYDFKKLRRRIEDRLRKINDEAILVETAQALGVDL